MAAPNNRIVPDASTKLAAERTRLAYERTLMAWLRTGVSLITFGFTIYKFFEEFRQGQQITPSRGLFGARGFGFAMISIGLMMVLLATIQHITTMRKLRAQYGDVPYSLAAVFAFLISVLGILALIDVFIRL
jgi:putative membrane protein